MNAISRKNLMQFCKEHPDAKEAHELLDAWYRLAKRAKWQKFADLKAVCKSPDVVGRYTVINIGGSKYRLILEIFYESSLVLIRFVLTHEEYEENKWREDAYLLPGKKAQRRKRTKRNDHST